MNSLDKMEEEQIMEQHLSQYREWCEQRGIILSEESENTFRDGFKDGIAHVNSKHSAILEDYDRLAKLCEKQEKEIQELRKKLNEMTERHTS